MDFPRILISALRGGAGKTMLSIGIAAAWKESGKKIIPFKKGPDYIDAGWLALAAGCSCYNLDNFLIPKEQIIHSFYSNSRNCDIAVIEGNRGLYDGMDIYGSTSTAELAKLLNTPVVLCIDCTKSTRSMAAVVMGCMKFDPDLTIKGVILNRVAGPRHEKIARKSIEYYCNIPVFGAIPKLKLDNFPERHMGLIPTPEHAWAKDAIDEASKIARQHIDLDALVKIAMNIGKPPLSLERKDKIINIEKENDNRVHTMGDDVPRIGVIKDSAFQFYYPENIEALENAGAQIVFISPLNSDQIPMVDGLYIGGGFPETHARELVLAERFRRQLKDLAEKGLPVYAECGGLMYLGEKLVLNNESFPMAGVLPVVFGFSKRPQGHGYTIMEIDQSNPYYKVGTILKGHEFHYSMVLNWRGKDNDMVFKVKRGAGFTNKRDGLCYKNVLATYTHIHALGTPFWAKAVVGNAIAWMKSKK